MPVMMHDDKVTVPLPPMETPPPERAAELPVIVHDDKVTDEVSDNEMDTPPPNPPCPLAYTKVAVLPVMVQDDKVTVPDLT